MNVKYGFIIVILLLALNPTRAKSQDKQNDLGGIALTAWIPGSVEGLPSYARVNLENKLTQLVLKNGLSSSGNNSRFIISANMVVLTKNVTATVPPRHAYTFDLTFYIGDGFEGKSFSSYSTMVKGVGENTTKAYMNAIRNIQATDPGYQSFIKRGRQGIINYYNSNCERIIREAQTMAKMNQYDEAIWMLTSVPNECKACWNKSYGAIPSIYQQKINNEGRRKLAKAIHVWNANQSWDGAQDAGAILAEINPDADMFDQVFVLAERISKKIVEVDDREWDFHVQKRINLESERIQAYRDVGVAFGSGQPKNITYKSLW